MRKAILVAGALVVSACSPSDPSAGSAPGGSAAPYCSTGTLVALSDPAPGTHVSPRKRTIVIASNALITRSDVALAVEDTNFESQTEPLYGPVTTPTPSPTPPPAHSRRTRPASLLVPLEFPSPLYYAARGFSLAARETYSVKVASIRSSCRPSLIQGASFKTTRSGKRP